MLDRNVLIQAESLVRHGANPDALLLFLRERGFTKFECFKAIRELLGESVERAKDIVETSATWSDKFSSDATFRETLYADFEREFKEDLRGPK